MDLEIVEKDFRHKVCEQLRLVPEGMQRYRVFTPFMFDDGDHLAITLKRDADNWFLTDDGNTYMHLTYDLDEKDFHGGNRQKIIANALTSFSVIDRGGELIVPIQNNRYGDALFDFIQALLRISDVTYFSRESVRSTFIEDFRRFVAETVPKLRRDFDWYDPSYDPDGLYAVDCRVTLSNQEPLLLYALPNDAKVRDATIAFQQYEKWKVPHRAVGIFENQEDVNRKVLARFSDVCDKQFSSLSSNKERLKSYLADTQYTN